jgi:tryptophanyl-tRNA synthetase
LVFTYHKKFNQNETPEIDKGCRSGALGCVDCKLKAANSIIDHLAPFREKRAYFESHPQEVKDILRDGESKAKTVAVQTMAEVHEAMKLG